MNSNGRGSIHPRTLKKKDKRGKFVVVYDVHYRDDEGRSQTKRGFKDKEGAQQFLNFLTAQFSQNLYVKRNTITVEQFLDMWFDFYKSSGVRTLDMHPYIVRLLKEVISERNDLKAEPLYNDNDYADLIMIQTRNKSYLGKAFSEAYYNDILNRAVAKAEIQRLRFHDLRHSYGSNLIYQGIQIPTVSKLLGHEDAAITLKIYTHLIHELEKISRKQIADKLTQDLQLLKVSY